MEWYSSELARPSHKKSERYLHINNCGYYKGIKQGETVGTFRPFGLPDYQIIYLTEGSMSFLVDGITKILSAGDIIIYPPDTAQKYKSISESGASYIWVHFTGFAAEDMILSSGLTAGKIYSAWPNQSVYSMIMKMGDELRIKRTGSETRANGLFLELLSFLARELKSDRKSGNRYSRILPALRDMEKNAGARRSNEEYAKMCGLTPYYFIHLFKEVTFFFFNDTATTENYTLSLHDALPIWSIRCAERTSPRDHVSRICTRPMTTPSSNRQKTSPERRESEWCMECIWECRDLHSRHLQNTRCITAWEPTQWE